MLIDLLKLIKLTECPRLAKKYAGIVALPLDLPKFELDSLNEFWQIWDQQLVPVSRQNIDRGAVGLATPEYDKTQWDGLALYEDEKLLGNAAWRTTVSNELAVSQPTYLKSIMERLPFNRIRSVRLWSAHVTIPPHYDGNMPAALDGKMHFPTEIRIMLDDKNPQETFYLCSNTKYKPNTKDVIPDHDKYYVRLPSDTNSFAWNNEDFLHGADFNPQYRKILVVVKGWVDIDKLEALLDASIAKYPDFVLREKND